MRVQITLDVYSGLTNPSWVVDLDPAMVATITRRLAELPTTPVRLRCGLGYRGFIVRPIDRSDMPTAFRLNRGLVQVSRSQQVHIDREAWLERWALGTAPQGTDPFALQLVQRAIDSPTQPPPCETPTGPPPFDPSEWHTTEGLRNNCYNYVTRNLFTSGVATPGRKGGKSVFMGVPCENFSLRLVGDGLSPLSDRQEVFTKDHDPSVARREPTSCIARKG